tara:strand:- start:39 stop:452 length:414 start_codon:yes stop_codon:yes gene_type:complete
VSTTEKGVLKKRGRGRPRKSEIAAVKPGNKGKVGRPKGDAAIINEYKARMLASPKSRLVLETIFDAALDNEHKNQASAWKLIMDRMLPVGAFEKEVIKDAGRSSIQINISGVGSVGIDSAADSVDNEVIEGEVVDEA